MLKWIRNNGQKLFCCQSSHSSYLYMTCVNSQHTNLLQMFNVDHKRMCIDIPHRICDYACNISLLLLLTKKDTFPKFR